MAPIDNGNDNRAVIGLVVDQTPSTKRETAMSCYLLPHARCSDAARYTLTW
jgi:hypothetical protein